MSWHEYFHCLWAVYRDGSPWLVKIMFLVIPLIAEVLKKVSPRFRRWINENQTD